MKTPSLKSGGVAPNAAGLVWAREMTAKSNAISIDETMIAAREDFM
jgi:hypothetical protein